MIDDIKVNDWVLLNLNYHIGNNSYWLLGLRDVPSGDPYPTSQDRLQHNGFWAVKILGTQGNYYQIDKPSFYKISWKNIRFDGFENANWVHKEDIVAKLSEDPCLDCGYFCGQTCYQNLKKKS